MSDFVPAADSITTVEDVVCTGCGCACDDVVLKVENNRILEARNACAEGREWFLRKWDDAQPACVVEGREVSLDDGIACAAEILAAAKHPLVYGLTETTTDAQRAAVAIADLLGGVIDTPTSKLAGPTATTFQGVGEVSCSLGEIRHRADLVIFWAADPATTHGRFLTRFVTVKGDFLPGGRDDRTIVVVDTSRTPTAELADRFIQLKPGSDFEALWTLRALVAGVELDAADVKSQTGVELAVWRELADAMLAARYGAILAGEGLMSQASPQIQSDAVAALVRDLNAKTRFVSRRLRGHGNASGADNVLTWQTGYPFAVDLSHGYPRFGPNEFSAENLLSRGETDAALIVACDPALSLSKTARARLNSIPVVTVGFRESETSRAAKVAFRTATYGIHTGGTVYRMDDVPLPLRPALCSKLPSEEKVLATLERKIREVLDRS